MKNCKNWKVILELQTGDNLEAKNKRRKREKD
jgi:hypothetical protein